MQFRAGSDYALGLWFGIVKAQRGSVLVGHGRAGFCGDQRTGGDVPFPAVAEGEHRLKAAFGNKRQPIGDGRAVVAR